jgi:hypothetical protein
VINITITKVWDKLNQEPHHIGKLMKTNKLQMIKNLKNQRIFLFAEVEDTEKFQGKLAKFL